LNQLNNFFKRKLCNCIYLKEGSHFSKILTEYLKMKIYKTSRALDGKNNIFILATIVNVFHLTKRRKKNLILGTIVKMYGTTCACE